MLTLSKLWLDNNADETGAVGGGIPVPPGYERIQVKARSQFSTTYHVKRGGCIRVNFYLVGIGFRMKARGMADRDGAAEEVIPFEGSEPEPEPRYRAGREVSIELDYFYLSRFSTFRNPASGPPQSCCVVLQWDNLYSLLTRKVVHYRVRVLTQAQKEGTEPFETEKEASADKVPAPAPADDDDDRDLLARLDSRAAQNAAKDGKDDLSDLINTALKDIDSGKLPDQDNNEDTFKEDGLDWDNVDSKMDELIGKKPEPEESASELIFNTGKESSTLSSANGVSMRKRGGGSKDD